MALNFNATTENNRVDSFGYDAAGDVTGDATYDYTYDAENRITKVTLAGAGTTVATYVYNASGRRVEKTTSAGTFYYLYDLAGHMISRLSSTGSWKRGEVFAGGRHVATYASTGDTTYFDHGDWLGTERARTDVNGAVCETIESLPFGDGMETSGNCGDPSPLHFTGKQRDSETGLDYFGARYDSSSVGRFMTPDWSASPTAVPYAKLGDPQSLNLYVYAADNPVTILDSEGHCFGICVAVAIGAYAVYKIIQIHYHLVELNAIGTSVKAEGRLLSFIAQHPNSRAVDKIDLNRLAHDYQVDNARLYGKGTQVASELVGLAETARAGASGAPSGAVEKGVGEGVSVGSHAAESLAKAAARSESGLGKPLKNPGHKPPKKKCTATGMNGCPLPPPATSSQPSTGPNRT